MYFVFAGEEIGGCFTFSLLEFIVSFQFWESMRERERERESICFYVCVFACVCCSHTGKCIRRFAGICAYCRYFIDRKW